MVEISLIIRSFLVPAFVSLLFSFLFVGWVYVNRIQPITELAEQAVKKSMSALGTASGVVRNQKAFDQELAESVITDKFPGLDVLLGLLNPDLAEKVKENPTMALNFLKQYGPTLGIGNLGGAAEQPTDF